MELLGRATQVDPGTVSATRSLFVTGNTDFRSGAGRVFVNFIVIEVNDLQPLPGATVLGFGAAPTYNQWGVVAVGAAPWNAPGATPIILYPSIGLAQTFPPPVFGVGLDFGVKNIIIGATTQLLTISCYGWAEN